MIPTSFMVAFAIAWCVGVAYVGSLMAVMFRLRRLEDPSARLDFNALAKQLGPEALRFLFSGRHRQIGDREVTRLLFLCRALFAIAVPLYAYVFWQAWLLSQLS